MEKIKTILTIILLFLSWLNFLTGNYGLALFSMANLILFVVIEQSFIIANALRKLIQILSEILIKDKRNQQNSDEVKFAISKEIEKYKKETISKLNLLDIRKMKIAETLGGDYQEGYMDGTLR